MKRFLVIGAGMQGVAAGHYLAKQYNKVFFMDLDVEKAKAASEKVNGLLGKDLASFVSEPRPIDFYNERTNKLIASYHGVFSSATFKINLELTKLCIKHSVHMVDLGGNNYVVEDQLRFNVSAMQSQVTILPDFGLAPGLANVLGSNPKLAQYNPKSVEIYCGGIPDTPPRDELKYKLVFSFEGLLNEYFEDCVLLKDGEIKRVPGFSECEEVGIPNGKDIPGLEAFHTSGGASRAPYNIKTFYPSLENYVYKTVRYKGHHAEFQRLLDDGLLTTPHATSDLEEYLNDVECDNYIILYVKTEMEDGSTYNHMLEVRDCEKTGFTAMAQATAYPAAEALIMAAHRELPLGVRTPDCTFINRLSFGRYVDKLRRDGGLNIEGWFDGRLNE